MFQWNPKGVHLAKCKEIHWYPKVYLSGKMLGIPLKYQGGYLLRNVRKSVEQLRGIPCKKWWEIQRNDTGYPLQNERKSTDILRVPLANCQGMHWNRKGHTLQNAQKYTEILKSTPCIHWNPQMFQNVRNPQKSLGVPLAKCEEIHWSPKGVPLAKCGNPSKS